MFQAFIRKILKLSEFYKSWPDMEIVGSTGSTLPEPSLENTLRSHASFIFSFEEP